MSQPLVATDCSESNCQQICSHYTTSHHMISCALTAQAGHVPPVGCHRLQAEEHLSTFLHTAGVVISYPNTMMSGMLTAQAGAHAGSCLGLYIPDPSRERQPSSCKGPWATQYNTWLVIILMPEGVVFFLFFLFLFFSSFISFYFCSFLFFLFFFVQGGNDCKNSEGVH